jgi:uncharacterized membrane protein (UPF0127 family)
MITSLSGTGCTTFSAKIELPKGVELQSTAEIAQSKMKSRIGFLFRKKASFTHDAKHILVKLTILPILDIGDFIYKIASNTLLSKLEVVYHPFCHQSPIY